MPLTLVSHSPCPPALYGAMAASVAQAEDAELMHLPVEFPVQQGADSVQMVAASGSLVPSGLLWYERMTARQVLPASSVESIIAVARHSAVVVPWDAAHQSGSMLDTLLAQASAAGVQIRPLTVINDDDRWYMEDQKGHPTDHGHWGRDTFGRWMKAESARPQTQDAPALSIALLGTEADQRNVYPATLAALGDAAEAANLDLRVRFVDPVSFTPEALDSVKAIVLPGGSDMANVPGQISAARQALASGIPVLGLCLGMQSMTTALAQGIPGLEQANMAEAAPNAVLKSFVAMAGLSGLEDHRLGDRRLKFAISAMEQKFQNHAMIRCNHRFMLNPKLIDALLAAGMVVTATDATGQIVDAMAWPHHPFFQGMQGHPEQGSGVGKPHPLIVDFLRAAGSSANDRPANQRSGSNRQELHP